MSKTNDIGGIPDRFWYPRSSDGMTLSAWRKLLKAGRYKIAPVRWGMAGIVTGLALFVNSPAALLQNFVYGRKIRETAITDPVFVIGHWRSGTTLLHEYLIQDKRFGFADTYACFTPEHFIVSQSVLRPLAAWLMPKKRSIDNMLAGFDRPQEDEFALMSMGVPTPYRNIIFGKNGLAIDSDYLTLRNLSEDKQQLWLDALEYLLKTLTFHRTSIQRIVLKSPPHTGRIATLLKRFPNAKFVHLHRHPYALYPSTLNLWKRLSFDQGLQRPDETALKMYVLNSLNTMYETFDDDVKALKMEQYCNISYDELTTAPVAALEKIYTTLQLGGFDSVRQTFQEFADSQKTYQKNKFALADNLKKEISGHWRDYFLRFGYDILYAA